MCSFNILIIVLVKLLRIEKLEACHASCEIILIFCAEMTSESIHHTSEKFQAKHFSHQYRISIKNSCSSDHSSSSICNLSTHSDFNLESQASYENYEIMYASY